MLITQTQTVFGDVFGLHLQLIPPDFYNFVGVVLKKKNDDIQKRKQRENEICCRQR